MTQMEHSVRMRIDICLVVMIIFLYWLHGKNPYGWLYENGKCLNGINVP